MLRGIWESTRRSNSLYYLNRLRHQQIPTRGRHILDTTAVGDEEATRRGGVASEPSPRHFIIHTKANQTKPSSSQPYNCKLGLCF